MTLPVRARRHRIVLSTGALRAHLQAARLAGPVATSREESLRNYQLFAARDPRVLIGLVPEWEWRQLVFVRVDGG
ncbi:phosphatase [Streptomyces sp. AC550_RSS872]|uniref:phosphatase n=1 Tax=Streptomyces sp. AC550_RSS872 TaxID=2823689 RepID=UPI0035AC1B6C